MEPDTVPYDADDAAWQGWQVPPAQQVPDDAIPPTLCYDTFMADPVSGFEPSAEPPGPSSEVDAAATLAYEADAGGFPQPYGVPSGQPLASAYAEAATQQYGDTLVLEHEGDTQEAELTPVDLSPAPVAAPVAPAPVAPAPVAPAPVAPAPVPPAPVAPPPVAPTPVAPAPVAPVLVAPAPVAPAQPASPPPAPAASSAPAEIRPEPAAPAAPAVSPPKVSPRKSPVASPKAATTKAVSSPRQEASPAVPAASSKVPGLMRLWRKQPPPPGYLVAPGPPKRKSAPARMARPAASTLPAVAGCRVRIEGDGWGGGTGQYEATVVDGDELSFTVIYIGENKKHQETHVMREFCTLLEPPIVEEPKTSRRRTC